MKTIQNKKPINVYAETKHKKTKITEYIEKELNPFSNIDNDSIQKPLSTLFKNLNEINPNTKLDFIYPIIEDMKKTENLKELRLYINLLNA